MEGFSAGRMLRDLPRGFRSVRRRIACVTLLRPIFPMMIDRPEGLAVHDRCDLVQAHRGVAVPINADIP